MPSRSASAACLLRVWSQDTFIIGSAQ
jgi:hypothetical protein